MLLYVLVVGGILVVIPCVIALFAVFVWFVGTVFEFVMDVLP